MTLADDALRALSEQQSDVFALLDGARTPRILELLRASEARYGSLFDEGTPRELAEVGPFLVHVPKDSSLLRDLLTEGLRSSWGLFVASSVSFETLCDHFRRFLVVQAADGRELYFRFYDPRVLGAFLPTCSAEQITEFFGPVDAFFVEEREGGGFLAFRQSAGGLGVEQVHRDQA